MTDEGSERLLEIEQIRLLKARYCRFVDEKDWQGLEALFAEDVAVEIGGAPDGEGVPRSFAGRGSFLKELQRLLAPLVTVHHVHAPEIEILSDKHAIGVWAVADRLSFPPGSEIRILQGYGHYREEYRKVGGRWRIASMRLTRLLMESTCAGERGTSSRSAGQLR